MAVTEHRVPAGVAGFTLLEVMVAVMVLSTALIGLAYLQVLGLRSGNSAYLRSQATVLAYNMGERVRADAAHAASYAIPLTETPPTAPSGSGKTITAQADWLTDLVKTLPKGKGGVAYTATGGVESITVTVQWSDNSQLASAKTQTYAYSARL